MKNIIFSVICLSITIVSCQKKNDKNPQLIGNWQGHEWLLEDKPSDIVASQVHFEFLENGDYASGFGNQNDKGKWRTELDKLYTVAEGKQEIMVKIIKLDPDTLRFEMNRGGRKETMTLLKKK